LLKRVLLLCLEPKTIVADIKKKYEKEKESYCEEKRGRCTARTEDQGALSAEGKRVFERRVICSELSLSLSIEVALD
jgi:hypothetical protein